VRAGYLGPEGTFTHEALTAAAGSEDLDLVALPTIYDTVMAVGEGEVERALVPIENSLEGSVNATLDALAMETEDVVIVGELVHPIRHCLIARDAIALESIGTVASIPQATAQCARFIRARLRGATVIPANSTADAVRMAAEADGTWAALGNRLAAELYGCEVLQAGVEDLADNETRFVWLARKGADSGTRGPWKTSIVLWGASDDAPD
jgi:prephenate dehydratase